MPALRIRATAPPHSSMSGFIGFLISTVTSEPFSASAISCTLNGLTVVRAPTQITSTPNSSAASTCLDVATSVPIGKPVISRARLIHASPLRPTPSNEPGFVRGFQMPALSTSTRPVSAIRRQVSSVCSSVSALHGPEIMSGRFALMSNGFI